MPAPLPFTLDPPEPSTLAIEGVKYDELNLLLSEHLLGWRWYTWTPTAEQLALDAGNISGIQPGERFLAEPSYGAGMLERGLFAAADPALPIAPSSGAVSVPAAHNLGIAMSLLLHADGWRLSSGGGPQVICVAYRGADPFTARRGFCEGPQDQLAAVICLAIARAWGLLP